MIERIPKIHNCFLFLPSAIALSHLTRLVLIAQELQQRGAEIAFVFPENNQILQHYNFQFFPVADAVITDFSSNVFAAYTPSLIEQCVNDELKAIEAFKPDAIIGDFRLTGAISSKIAGVPYISIVNGYMTDYFDPVDVMIPKDKRPLDYKIASIAAKAIQGKQKRDLATHFREYAQKHKLKNLVSLYDFLRGDLTLIADLPQFCPLENLPPNFRYIGPLIWEGFNATVPDFLKINQSKQIIYATTGNTGKEKFIQLIIDAFKNDNAYEVVLTTGAFIHPDAVPNIPNIHVTRFIPGSEIMKHSQAVIHCGGNGTTYQALSQGVSAVVIPFNNDQNINAWLVKKNKLGIPLSPSELTGNQVKLAVKKLLDDADIQNKVQHFKQLLTNIDAPKSAADQISTLF
ncbi:glycosyltransferase [Floridanema aerugineum]|uniref:Glycosyltransferase n=1 Tax=Floridaenema aerugineum BLCC-F46 TaxID=3153654 RepID=A0ABV4X3K2_9CYAN